MSAQPIARRGDELSHGGQIVEGSPTVYVDGRPVARVEDRAQCSQHGPVTIVDGNDALPINGRAAARVGSRCSCGAVIVTGSASVYSNR